MIELCDLEHLDDIPEEELSPEFKFFEALEEICPSSRRISIGNEIDIPALAEKIRKKVGKKAIKRYVRDNYHEFVEAVKNEIATRGSHITSCHFMQARAEREMNRRFKYFDPFSSNLQSKVIYHILVRYEWWL